jgi:hypothetical protein
MKKAINLLICIFFISCLSAQEKTAEIPAFKYELGLNATGLLTNLLGNSNQIDLGTYLISYKRLRGNKAFRLGTTVNVSFRKDNTGSFDTKLNSQNFQLRMGEETRHDISKKCQYYFGFDGLIGYRLEESKGTTNSSFITQKDVNFSLGLGPVVGIQFAVYERLLIGTEGSLYAVYNKNSISFNNSQSSFNSIPTRDVEGLNVLTALPKFLFVILKF